MDKVTCEHCSRSGEITTNVEYNGDNWGLTALIIAGFTASKLFLVGVVTGRDG